MQHGQESEGLECMLVNISISTIPVDKHERITTEVKTRLKNAIVIRSKERLEQERDLPSDAYHEKCKY